MKRREFITLLGGAAAAWPLAARAQQGERVRRVGWFTSLAADDPVPQAYIAALLQGLEELGWSVGRNVRIDYRWGAANAELKRRYAAELIALGPDVIVTTAIPIPGPCFRRPAACRSCLSWCPIRLGPALLRASRDPAATPPGS